MPSYYVLILFCVLYIAGYLLCYSSFICYTILSDFNFKFMAQVRQLRILKGY